MISRRAFTIIELLVAMTIIMLIISAASFGIYSARRNGRDTRRLYDVLTISRAIDQSVTLNRGLLPRNIDPAANNITMCAHQIGNIDTSIFQKGQIPRDPLPYQSIGAGTCTTMLDGYTYHTEYLHTSGLGLPNPAVAQGVTYVLEVGLEAPAAHDEIEVQTPSAIGAAVAASFPNTITGSTRIRYFLNGQYCGGPASCYK